MKTPQNPAHIEKIRQEVMRFRELLDITRHQLERNERAYANLFAGLSDEEKQGKQEKALQTLVAYQLDGDLKPLADAVLRARFDAREMEKAFEELFDTIQTPPIMDED